ncbi:MAG: iron-sulfur cluster repair di-iron protein [Planctomycetes bacterium]|nr:iron-sulfur cluster repair di-iron protein [Planctomycetota bacterium]
MNCSPTQSLGELVTERPTRSRVFEQYKLDYCCGGGVSLERACEKRGLDVNEIIAQLEDEGNVSEDQIDLSSMNLEQLCDHIESTHHEFMKAEMPKVREIISRVVEVHGERLPWLAEFGQIFKALDVEISEHLMKEEQVLFPMLRSMSRGEIPEHQACGVQSPIAVMEMEHDNAGDALARLSELSSGYDIPDDACNKFRAVMTRMAEIQEDLHRHIHKENSVLHPMALAKDAE